VAWIGDNLTDIAYDLKMDMVENIDEAVEEVKVVLQNNGIIFKS